MTSNLIDNVFFCCQVLAFYSQIGGEHLRSFDVHEADLRLQDMLQDIRLLLTGALLPSSDGSTNSPSVSALDRGSMV